MYLQDWMESRRQQGKSIHPYCNKVKRDPLETECTEDRCDTYLHISTHIYTYLHTYLHISTHIYSYLHISTHIYTYLHISTYPGALQPDAAQLDVLLRDGELDQPGPVRGPAGQWRVYYIEFFSQI